MSRLIICISLLLLPFCRLIAQEASYETKKWRIGISAGGGYLLAGTKDAVRAFESLGIDRQKAKDGVDALKWQLHLGGDAHYFVNEHWGVGLKYLFANSNGTIKDVIFNMNGDGITNSAGNIESEYFINYIGPSFTGRFFFGEDERFALNGILSAGYSHLRMEQLTIDSPAIGTSHTFGLFTSIGIEYFLTRQLSLGCDLGMFGSSFREISYENNFNTWKLDLEDMRDNVSNINLALSLRVHL